MNKDIICPYCLRSDFASDEALIEHMECDHQFDMEKDAEKLTKIVIENKDSLDAWKQQKKKELLLQAHPSLIREIQRDPLLLDQLISKHLFKEAILKGKPESTFDRMVLSSIEDGMVEVKVSRDAKPIKMALKDFQRYFAETYRAQPQIGSTHHVDPVSGQSEETIPIDSPNAEARKVLERSSLESLSKEDRMRIFAEYIRSLRTKQKRSEN